MQPQKSSIDLATIDKGDIAIGERVQSDMFFNVDQLTFEMIDHQGDSGSARGDAIPSPSIFTNHG